MAYKLVLSDDALKQLKKMDRHVGLMLAKDLKNVWTVWKIQDSLARPWLEIIRACGGIVWEITV